MEDNSNVRNNFETILKTYSVSKSLIYSDNDNEGTAQSLKSKDVIKNISMQIKAYNSNETHVKTVKNEIKAYKKSRLTCINKLPLETQQKHLVGTACDNLCGYETQLLLATKNAETITDLGTGVTEEFETSFDQNPNILESPNKVSSNIYNESIISNVLQNDVPSQYQLIEETTLNNGELLYLANEDIEIDNSSNICDMQKFVSEYNTISSKPITLSKKTKPENNTTFLLESFEKFEAIASPLVHTNSDVEAVKTIINFKMLHVDNSQVRSERRQYDDNSENKSIQLSPILKLKTDPEEINRPKNCDLLIIDEFVDEEILFSSDEETDNDQNQVGDLPLTSALQTSIYEQEHVLNKTIYVGFQTASNKSIQVLTDSFTRAKSILDDCYNTKKPIHSLSLSELVAVYDSASKKMESGSNPIKSKSSTETVKTSKICNKENKLSRIDPHNENLLFKTNKGVVCTQEQINIDDYMMQEFEENLCIDDNKLHTNLCVSNQHLILNNDGQFKSNDNTNNNYRLQTSTLGKEQHKINKEKYVIQNFDIDDETLCLNECQTDKSNNNSKGINQLLTGFKTASNKCINISNDALVKSKKILDEFNLQSSLTADVRDDNIYGSKNIIDKEFQGFTTASNKFINISDEAYAQSEKIFKEIQFPLVTIDKNENLNKKETPESTKIMSNIIHDQYFNIKESSKVPKSKIIGLTNSTNAFHGFKTASSHLVKISDEALENNKKILEEVDNWNNFDLNQATYYNRKSSRSPSTQNGFHGFKTARNNPVKISDEALDKSKKIFQEVGDWNTSDLDQFKHYKAESGRFPSTKNFFQGFKTASNNPVKISDEALEKSKKIIQEVVDWNTSDLDQFKHYKGESSRLPSTKNAVQGFRTARNNPVKISDEALDKSKKIFQEVGDWNTSDLDQLKYYEAKSSTLPSTKNDFQGFKTASNNPVKISDEALEKSKKIIQEVGDWNTSNLDQFKHYKGESIRLPITKNVFQDFKTASSNPVKISDEALQNSKKIFQDIGDYNNYYDSVKTRNNESSGLNTLNDAFEGFKTASNNPVKISKKALEQSKKIFHDVDGKIDCDNYSPEMLVKNCKFSEIGFQTPNKKRVKLSEKALKNSKIPIDIDSNLNIKTKQKFYYDIASRQKVPDKTGTYLLENKMNILKARKTTIKEEKTSMKKSDFSNIFNTEVIDNFNDTMLTEDFLNKSPSYKRLGSPILSCPKAKKIKTKVINQPKFEDTVQNVDKINQFIFNTDYKKRKKYKLLDVYEMEKGLNIIQSCKEVNYNIDNILSFEFVGAQNEISNSKWTTVDITKHFLELVNKNIIPNGWIENHIKLITLKLISYEKRFTNSMKNVCSVCNVMEQLKYRYERELYNVERPALRKVLEKDEVPSRRMVLYVLNIYKDGVSVTNTLKTTDNIELLLSDGWYCVKATLDKLLTKLICEGKITTGTKLVTHGAELVNCEQGVAPWEDTSLVRLKIFGNSTRRAHWAAKLGFHGNGAILSYLTTVKPEGGKISQLRVIVTRVYPMLYVEKFDDGSTVTRSERLENLYQMKFETERETLLEKIYEEVEKEFCMQASQCDSVDDNRKCLESGSQIYQSLKKSRDPAEFRARLTHSQAATLQDYIDRRREITLQGLQSKVQSVLKKRGLNVTRNVVAMLKIRVADVYKQNVTKAMITVWRPHESLLHLLREGTWLDMYNVVPTAVRYSEIQISAGKQSLFRKTSKVNDKMLNIARTFERKCYSIQELTRNPYIATDYNEVDTVGFVFDIEPSVREFDCRKQLFQNVFLADVNKKIICINFWGGLKKFGFENILETEQVVACVNLQKRSGNTRKNIPQYRATEFTYFTRTPKIDVCRKVCDDLSKQFKSLDRRKFIQDCIVLRNNLVSMKYGNIENISPYRFNNSDYNLSKNKMFINSPAGDPNLNLNGLDFESTFKQSDTALSPKALLRKKEINKRIAKLQKYGEPPPLSSIHVVNKSKDAVKPYRSPLIIKTEFNNNQSKSDGLASVKPQTATQSVVDPSDEKSRNECTSPVLPYRRRTANPVRLNFSKQNDVSKDDPFGEDFETSPPLSLD